MLLQSDILRQQNLPGPDTKTKAAAIKYAATDGRYAAMLKVCEETGWPKCWYDDVYRHDMEFLKSHPDTDFVWILRDAGSHLYEIGDDCSSSRYGSIRSCDYHSGSHNLNYYDMGDSMRPKFYHVRPGFCLPTICDQAKKLIQG